MNHVVADHHCDETGAELRQNGWNIATKRVQQKRCDKTGADEFSIKRAADPQEKLPVFSRFRWATARELTRWVWSIAT
jgi:hypothetical protein